MRTIALLLTVALLAGCSGVDVIDFSPAEEVKPFHPPLPPPITPSIPQPHVMTLKRAIEMLESMGYKVEYDPDAEVSGDFPIIYGFHAQDWLSYGQYDVRKDFHIRQLMEIIKWYGHPALQEKPDEPDAQPDTP